MTLWKTNVSSNLNSYHDLTKEDIIQPRRRAAMLSVASFSLVALCLIAFFIAPGNVDAKLMAVASGICPQRPDHSYSLGGAQLPLEARMAGIFAGFLITFIVACLSANGRRAALPTRRRFAALLALVTVMVIDGLNASLHDLGLPAPYAPDNAVRLATGLLAGVATALLFLPVVYAAIRGPLPGTGPFPRGPQTVALAALAALFWLALVAGWAWAFYPVALLSIGGLVISASMLNLLLLLSLSRRGRQNLSFTALFPFILFALALSAAQFATLAALRPLVL